MYPLSKLYAVFPFSLGWVGGGFYFGGVEYRSSRLHLGVGGFYLVP